MTSHTLHAIKTLIQALNPLGFPNTTQSDRHESHSSIKSIRIPKYNAKQSHESTLFSSSSSPVANLSIVHFTVHCWQRLRLRVQVDSSFSASPILASLTIPWFSSRTMVHGSVHGSAARTRRTMVLLVLALFHSWM
ncbi:uncharacterized protein G2W53_014305 [Senna tora]|uniref:Uncharacterized protein n=1 Tax=Senna tora TaxID=362788 RepID=A0A834WTA1_9FABA|nr:uncharacterized protein G2W53_014305 [Senna tora]